MRSDRTKQKIRVTKIPIYRGCLKETELSVCGRTKDVVSASLAYILSDSQSRRENIHSVKGDL